MKKIFTLLFLLPFTLAFGQTLNVFYNGVAVNSGDTLLLVVNEPNNDNNFHFDIKNTAEDTIWVQIKKERISLASEEVSESFCFGRCLPDNMNESDILPAAGNQLLSHNNESPHYFYTVYIPYGHQGTSVVKYKVINSRDVSDELCFTALYTYDVGIYNAKAEVVSFNAYPNPAEAQVTIKYNLKNNPNTSMKLVIKNIMGQVVCMKPVTGKANNVSVDVSNLPAGLYLYSLEANGAILMTKKLYVK
ncbi:T9SS type A sorting domain-containing protein [Bacteroidales bacterium OttesenSCG-928-B11]|nr:T9SS type A sorting domain-containing protein [Bacteroidales bacterium OttesenSCG-928-B11]